MLEMKRVVSVFALLLCGANLALAQAPKGGPGGTPPKPLAINALRLEPQTVTTAQELPGRTAPYEVADIRPQVSGIITARMFEEGSEVKAGAQLYQIDPAPYQAVYDSAQADLQKAQAQVLPLETKTRRLEELLAIEAVSQQEVDDLKADLAEAKANIAVASAAVARAKINLDYTKVYAPISGRIGSSLITKGGLVTANQAQALATITRLDPIYVDITQSSKDLMRIRQGLSSKEALPVSLQLEDEPGPFPQKGKLLFHEVAVDPSTGSVKLRAVFPNPDRLLLPGLFVRARIEMTYSDALLVPQRATQRQPDGSLAAWTVAEDNTARPVPIAVVRAVGSSWLVREGLKPGDAVILNGHINLRPGAPVNPTFVQLPAENAQGRE